MNIKYYILSFLLFITGGLFAQGVKFTAAVSKATVGTGEQFEVDFSVNADGSNFAPPDLNDFQLLAGPNVSTNMQFINGKATMSSSFSYVLMATKEGSYTIAPASIVVNGRKLTSNDIKLTVVKGRSVPQNNQSGRAAQRQERSNNTADLSKNLFLRSVTDKNTVYQGQQLTLAYRIYTRVDILQNQVDKMPDLTGFWSQDIKTSQPAQLRLGTYKGNRYNIADLKQIILFPEHTGNITIDPFGMSFIARIQTQPRDFMDQFFGGNVQEVNYAAKSLPVVIHVKPLPEGGKPAGFSGAVGSFTIESSIDKDHLKANEAINYKIKITGTGNIKLLKNLNPIFPADFEKYDPKITDTVTVSEKGVSGSRIYNYLLIPRHKGDFKIDPIQFSYFNPTTDRYTNLATKSFDIKVEKGINENNVTALAGDDKQDVKLLDKDIHYIKIADAQLRAVGDRFYGSLTFYLLLLSGPVLCGVAFVYRNQQRKNNSDVVKVKSKRAGKIAAKHLANAQKELDVNNTTAFYEATFKGLYGYLSDKLNISYADLDRETIATALKARSVNEGLITQLHDTLDLCEMARYAPVTHISKQEVLEKAKNIINAIENEI